MTTETLTAAYLDSNAADIARLCAAVEAYALASQTDPSDPTLELQHVACSELLESADRSQHLWECDDRPSTSLYDARLRGLRDLLTSISDEIDRAVERCRDTDMVGRFEAEIELRGLEREYASTRGV